MEKLKRFKFSPSFRKIIFCAVMVIAMTAFYILPVSADSYEPVVFSTNALNALFSMSDYGVHVSPFSNYPASAVWAYNNNSSTLENVQFLGSTSASFDTSYFNFSGNSFYPKFPFKGVVYTGFGVSTMPSNNSTNFRYIINFPINFYLYDTDLSFYILMHNNSTITFNASYFDSDNQVHNITSTSSTIVSGKLGTIISDSHFNSSFRDWYSAHSSLTYKTIASINSDFTYTTGTQSGNGLGQFTLYYVTLHFDNSQYHNVSSININFNNSSLAVGNYIIPYLSFDTSQSLTFYEYKSDSGSVDLSYIEDMLDTIGGQLDDVNDKLDDITGEPSSENQQQQAILQEESSDAIAEIDDALSEWRRAEEMPTLPFDEQTQRIPIPENGELDSYNGFFYTFFTQFPLVQQIITSGCVCLIFYVLFRRV